MTLRSIFHLVLALSFGFSLQTFAEDRSESDKERLPEAIQKKLDTTFPNLSIKEIEIEKRKSSYIYEIEGKLGDQEYEVVFSSDGTIIKVKIGDDDDEDDDHEDKDDDKNQDRDGDDDHEHAEHGGKNAGKVTICHKGKTIRVNRNALKAHLNHGDTIGACNDAD